MKLSVLRIRIKALHACFQLMLTSCLFQPMAIKLRSRRQHQLIRSNNLNLMKNALEFLSERSLQLEWTPLGPSTAEKYVCNEQ